MKFIKDFDTDDIVLIMVASTLCYAGLKGIDNEIIKRLLPLATMGFAWYFRGKVEEKKRM